MSYSRTEGCARIAAVNGARHYANSLRGDPTGSDRIVHTAVRAGRGNEPLPKREAAVRACYARLLLGSRHRSSLGLLP